MIHIGISGPIGAGKSTLAKQLQYLAHEAGYAAEIIPFATGLRELLSFEGFVEGRVIAMANMIANWGWDYMKAHLAAIMIDQYMIEYPSTPGVKNRRLLQYVGTEVGRNFIHPDFWIYRVQQLIRSANGGIVDFVISDDLRFDNEALAVDVHAHITLTPSRLECYSTRMQLFNPNYTYSNHASETSLSLPSLFTIPVCFTESEVQLLFKQLDYIRRLRL